MELQIGDILTLKKPHPCGSRDWQCLRLGADLRLRCQGCGRELLLPRGKLLKQLRAVNGERR